MLTKKIGFFIAAVFMILSNVSAQDSSALSAVREKFDNFEYRNVIDKADSLLKDSHEFSEQETAELLRMKGVSQFSLSDTLGAEESFKDILRLLPGFTLDSLNNSPKIISFFNEIKSRFKTKTETAEIKNKDNEKPLKSPPFTVFLKEYNDRLKNSLIRSIILPGWGHFYSGEHTKGWILSSLSAASLSSLIYFIADSRTKENTYLNERDPLVIPDRYDKYNLSNKLKYASLVTYAAVWLYSQADLLFFSDGLFKREINIQPDQIKGDNISSRFSLSVSIPF